MNEEIDLEEFAPWLAGAVTLAGGFLRAYLLDAKGMWLDETFSVWMASQSIADMLHWIVKIDQHPPLYYLLLHYWINFKGDTPFYARLLSVLFGAGTIPIIYLIGKRMSGAIAGLAAAVLLAVSPFNICYAQEARMYTLLAFNAAAAIYALVRLLSDPRSAEPIGSQFREYWAALRTPAPAEPEKEEEFSYRDKTRPASGWRAWFTRRRWLPIRAIETDLAWAALIVFTAAAMYSHNSAVLLPLAANVFVLGLTLLRRAGKPGSPCGLQAPSLANWVKAQIGILLLWSPWIIPFIRQAAGVFQRFWIPQPTWDSVIWVIKTFLNPSASIPAGQAAVVWALYILVLCLGVVHFRKRISHFVLLAALFAIPFLGELIVSIRRPIFYDRTLIWTTIPLYLVLAAGAAQLKNRLLIVLALGSLGTINLFSAGDYYRHYQKEDWATAAGYVAYFAEPGDLVLFNSNFVVIPFNYYFREYEQTYSLRVEKQGLPLDLFESGILEPEMTADDIPRLVSLLSGHDRVWLVYSHNAYTDPARIIPQTLAAEMELIRERQFYGGQVQLYGAP